MEEQLQLVRGVSPMEVQRFETLFKLFDEDGSGSISIRELADLMPRLGIFPSEEELHELFEATDADQSGDVDFSEFLSLMARQREENQLALLGRNRDSFLRLRQASFIPQRIAPDGILCSIWEAAILSAILFYLIVISLEDFVPSWEVPVEFKIIPSILFIVDILLRCFVISFVSHNELMISQQPQMVKAYLSSRLFIADVLAALPFDLLLHNYKATRMVIQHLRLAKVSRVPSMFPVIGRELITPSYTYFHFSFFPMMKLSFWAIFVVHSLTTIWLALKGDENYIDALYFVMYTITTTGYGDIGVDTQGQKVFAVVLFCCATLISGLVVGKLVKVSEQADLVSDTQTKMLETLAVMEHLCIPKDFAEEILAQQYHRLRNSFSIYSDAIDNLPQAMRDRMMLYARMKVVTHVPMFMGIHEICLAKLAQALVSVVVPPDEYIIIAGEEGIEMYFLFHGACDVWLANGTWIAYVKRGGVFGEIALLKKTRRAASIISLTYCQLFRLDKTSFDTISFEFPELYENVQAVAEKRVKHPEKKKESIKKESSDSMSETSECDNDFEEQKMEYEPQQPRRRKSTVKSVKAKYTKQRVETSPDGDANDNNDPRGLIKLNSGSMEGTKKTVTVTEPDPANNPPVPSEAFRDKEEGLVLHGKPARKRAPSKMRKPSSNMNTSLPGSPCSTVHSLMASPHVDQMLAMMEKDINMMKDRMSTLEMGISELLRRVPCKDNEVLQTRQVLVRNKASVRTPAKPLGASKSPPIPETRDFSPKQQVLQHETTLSFDDRPKTPESPRVPHLPKSQSTLHQQLQSIDSPTRRYGLPASGSFSHDVPSPRSNMMKRNLSFNMKQ
eukprot:TRINITY_DN1607_c4_g1_i1.p1 TRINITY_DN1607_c4_g1~~TRINITY_DN1607_c4_g1_i1.p1  ORF type:complete len:845 (+),score=105.27 TRINITY_DN1607_c4_g1_i1:72-2606(+)